MGRRPSHIVTIRIVALSGVLAGAAITAQGQGTGSFPLPDLTLEGPVESGSDWKLQTWTVKNVGPADSKASSLQVTCEVIYITPNSKTKCVGGVKLIPPMQKKSGSYPVTVAAYWVDLGLTSQTALPKYRLRITAKVDPSNAIQEVNELPASNQKVVVAENFSGPPPSSSLAHLGGVLKPSESSSSSPGSGRESASGTRAAAAGSGSPAAKPQAWLTLSTDKPYKAGETVWIVAKNTGGVASPAAKVKLTCVWLAGTWVNKECGFPSLKSREFSVPALAAGQFQAIGQYGGLVNDCYFQWADVPAGGLACIGTPFDDIPPAHRATLDLQGVMGFNLVLEAK